MSAARQVSARRPRRTTPVSDIERYFHDFAYNWRVAHTATRLRDAATAKIKVWFDGMGDPEHEVTVNENGSRSVEFDEPIVVDGVTIEGLENVRKESSTIDLDLVDEWLAALPEAKRVKFTKQLYKPVTDYVFQPDVLFKLQQEGAISEDELDAMYTTKVTWALNVKKA